MSVKIEANMSAVAHHIIDGPVTFPYAIDAHSAISRFPNEWNAKPWSMAEADAARRATGAPEVELSAEEQALIDEHAKAVAEAAERLEAYRAKKAEQQAEADQFARDEALVASPAPRPDPTIRRPFGRQGEPTPAELEQINKRIARDKAKADETGTV
jgi:hypothetical protein